MASRRRNKSPRGLRRALGVERTIHAAFEVHDAVLAAVDRPPALGDVLSVREPPVGLESDRLSDRQLRHQRARVGGRQPVRLEEIVGGNVQVAEEYRGRPSTRESGEAAVLATGIPTAGSIGSAPISIRAISPASKGPSGRDSASLCACGGVIFCASCWSFAEPSRVRFSKIHVPDGDADVALLHLLRYPDQFVRDFFVVVELDVDFVRRGGGNGGLALMASRSCSA